MAPSDEGKLLAADESRLFFTDKTASSEGRGGGGGGGDSHIKVTAVITEKFEKNP